MHSAKVINLPSHSATIQSNWMYKQKTKEKWLTCSLETVWMVAARWPSSAYSFHSCFPLLLCPLSSLFSLFFPAFSVLVMMNWGRCWLLLPIRDLGFVLVFLYRDVCRDEGNSRNNSLCMLDFFPLLLSVYYFFALGFFFFCSVFSVFGLIFPVHSPLKSPGSGFSSPFYRETCPSTSPAFAGLLFKSRAGSWARDVVHDLL